MSIFDCALGIIFLISFVILIFIIGSDNIYCDEDKKLEQLKNEVDELFKLTKIPIIMLIFIMSISIFIPSKKDVQII